MTDSAPFTEDVNIMKAIAESDDDPPVLMVNLNKYKAAAGYPNGKLYKEYMDALDTLLSELGGTKKFQIPVLGQPVGKQDADEILGIWYPSHKSFLSIKDQATSAKNFELRGMCVETAVIHRCPADSD